MSQSGYGHRHHRLTATETGPVFALVYRELWRLYESRGDPEAAGELVKVFHRFMTNKVGPPVYPKVWGEDEDGTPRFSWTLLHTHLLAWSETIETPDNVTINGVVNDVFSGNPSMDSAT